MVSKKIIIELIRQNMRHYQFIWRLEQLGMDMDNHYLDLCRSVARLMGLPQRKLSDAFVDTYCIYMEEAAPLPLTGTGEYLEPLAKKCFEELRRVISIE